MRSWNIYYPGHEVGLAAAGVCGHDWYQELGMRWILMSLEASGLCGLLRMVLVVGLR